MGVLNKALSIATKSVPFPGWGGYGQYGGWGAWSGVTNGRFPFFRGQPGERDWGKIVGDGSGNSLVEACVLWICRNFPEAPMIVQEEGDDGIPQIVRKHPLPRLWRRPNEYFSGTLLWYGVLTSFIVNGNAYVYKERNESGRIVRLWYIPHTMIIPRWNSPFNFIDWYEYQVMGVSYRLEVEDLYHLRYGIDPENTRIGRSPLRTLFRELGVDEEASRFSASILYNLGVPGIVISPDKDANPRGIDFEDDPKREAIKAKFKSRFGGDNRGDPIVMSKPTNIVQFGFSPDEMDLSAIRDVPEERVTAVIGIPPSVVGFQQQNSKVGATRAEERDQAYENCIIPTQRLVGDELTVQMLPDFAKSDKEVEDQEVTFDLSKVRVLLDAQNKVAERWTLLARGAVAMRKEARAGVGLSTSKDDEIYIPSPGVQEIKPDGTIIIGAGGVGALGPGSRSGTAGGQLALAAGPTNKDLDDFERKAREDRRDQLMMEGFKLLGESIREGMKEAAQASKPTTFRVTRDESGRLEGIERGN